MPEMDRRTFLLSTGKWLLVAGIAPSLAGCARALESGQETTNATTPNPTTAPATTGTTASAGPASTLPASSSSTAAGTGASSTTTKIVYPDLAVTKGETVDKNARAAIAMLGGMERFVKKGARVVIKPNVLNGRPPEYATTTSPEVMTSVIKMCWEAGAKEVVVFDRTTTDDRSAFDICGLSKAVQAADAKLMFLSQRNYEEVKIPQGKVLTSWPFVTDALTADTLINLTLPKAHSVSKVTMTMKNLMGIMGGSRGQIHWDFAHKIVDVNTLVKPHLAILDAYRVLFRNGPTGGNLNDVRLVKTLVAGTNQVTIDAYGTSFFDNLKPTDVEWLVEAAGRGMGEIDPSKMNIKTADA
jgi:uncharacterized protein (DUF362 family)